MKKNKFLSFIFVIIALFIICYFIYRIFVNENVSNNISTNNANNIIEKDNSSKINNISVNNDNIYSDDQLLNKIEGIWLLCSEKLCYTFRVYNENGINKLSLSRYGTSGGIFGNITEISYMDYDNYKITVYSEGCTGDGCLYEEEPKDYSLNINISRIADNIVIVDDDEYSFVSESWDDADKKIMEYYN